MVGKTVPQLKELLRYRKKERGSVTGIATRLGHYKETVTPEWLILTDKDKMPKAAVVAFPKPPSAPGNKAPFSKPFPSEIGLEIRIFWPEFVLMKKS